MTEHTRGRTGRIKRDGEGPGRAGPSGRLPRGLPVRRPADGVPGRTGLGELLGVAGGELVARGLEVREVRYNGELVEIADLLADRPVGSRDVMTGE